LGLRLAVGWVAMSERDMQRIRVLSEVLHGRRTEGSAAAVLAITPRQVRRLLVRLREVGARPSSSRVAFFTAMSRAAASVVAEISGAAARRSIAAAACESRSLDTLVSAAGGTTGR
jgi:hypothetical protein